MELYLRQIEQLVALQQVDHEIYHIKKELARAPQEIEDMEKEFSGLEERRNRVTEKLDHLKEQEKRLNLDIEEDASRIKKSKSKMLMVENSREYQAMSREMDNMERSNRTREEEKTVLMEELQRQTAIFEELDASHAESKENLDGKRASLQTRLDEYNAELDKLMDRRGEAKKDIPAPVLSRYEFIRERLENPVIVPVEERICSGCNIAIPPQTYIELQKCKQILSCPNCQRLIYWRVGLDHETTAKTG